LLFTEGYLGKFFTTEYPKTRTRHNASSINVSRLVLTFLKNRLTGYSSKGIKREDNTISLIELLSHFDGICDLEAVIEAIWFMFELRLVPFWNHLVTFQKLNNLDFSDLQQQLNDYKSANRVNNKYSTLRITPGGRYLLDNMLVHFEFFSCRLPSENEVGSRA